MHMKVVDDMSRFIVIELPGPATHEERKKIAETIAAAINSATTVNTSVGCPVCGVVLGHSASCGKETNEDQSDDCRCKRDDGSTRFNINCHIHGSRP